MSEQTVRRRADDGALPCATGPRGERRFAESDVRALELRESASREPGDEGERAAAMFDLFVEGVALVDVVRRTRGSPEEVQRTYRRWLELRDTNPAESFIHVERAEFEALMHRGYMTGLGFVGKTRRVDGGALTGEDFLGWLGGVVDAMETWRPTE